MYSFLAPGRLSGTVVMIQLEDMWQVYAQARAQAELVAEALLVEKSESGGGLIYWEEKATSGNSMVTELPFQRRGARLLQRIRALISLRSLRRTHVSVRFDFAPLLFHDTTQFALHRFERVVNYLF